MGFGSAAGSDLTLSSIRMEMAQLRSLSSPTGLIKLMDDPSHGPIVADDHSLFCGSQQRNQGGKTLDTIKALPACEGHHGPWRFDTRLSNYTTTSQLLKPDGHSATMDCGAVRTSRAEHARFPCASVMKSRRVASYNVSMRRALHAKRCLAPNALILPLRNYNTFKAKA